MGASLLLLQILNSKSEFSQESIHKLCQALLPCLQAEGTEVLKSTALSPLLCYFWLCGILGKETEDWQIIPTLQEGLC